MFNITERYELMAYKYYKETGKMAPGKDDCLCRMSNEEKDANRKEWGTWCDKFLSDLFDKNSSKDYHY